jgi:hypothetical protein
MGSEENSFTARSLPASARWAQRFPWRSSRSPGADHHDHRKFPPGGLEMPGARSALCALRYGAARSEPRKAARSRAPRPQIAAIGWGTVMLAAQQPIGGIARFPRPQQEVHHVRFAAGDVDQAGLLQLRGQLRRMGRVEVFVRGTGRIGVERIIRRARRMRALKGCSWCR